MSLSALLVIVVIGAIDATFTIVSPVDGPFHNVGIHCTAQTSMSGPQPGDGVMALPRRAKLVIFNGGLCDAASFPGGMAGNIILLNNTSGRCGQTVVYMNFLAANATAVVEVSTGGLGSIPGVGYFSRHRPAEDNAMRSGKMFWLIVEEASSGGSQDRLSRYLAQRNQVMTVEVFPDVNKWVPMFTGIIYQILTRWIPFAIFLFSSIAAFVYLYVHMTTVTQNYIRTVPNAAIRTTRRHAMNVWMNLATTHVVLLIEAHICLMLALLISILGWRSSPCPIYFMLFFNTMLSGWGFTCDMLSARMWSRVRRDVPGFVDDDDTLLTRIVSHHIAGPLLISIPLAIDTVVSIMYSLGDVRPIFILISVTILILLQLIAAFYFIFQSFKFQQSLFRRQQSNAVGSPYLLVILRIAKWKFRLGVAILIYVGAAPISATYYLYTPTGWTIFWSIMINTRAISSLCRVMMAQPSSFDLKMIHRQIVVLVKSIRVAPVGNVPP